MKVKKFLMSFVVTFLVTFVVSAIVTYIWDGSIEWETAFRFGLIFAIVLPSVELLKKKD
jgi:NhaP-type Na+/H+ or K+/H+ antiporter